MSLRSAIFAVLAAQLAQSAPWDTKAPAPPYVEINPSLLDPDIPAQLPPDAHRDLTFAFSPDERWLAIVADVYRRQDPRGRALGPFSITRVLLLPLNGRKEDVVEIDPHFIDPHFMVVGSPVWSPASDAFLVKGLALVPVFWDQVQALACEVFCCRSSSAWSQSSSGDPIGQPRSSQS